MVYISLRYLDGMGCSQVGIDRLEVARTQNKGSVTERRSSTQRLRCYLSSLSYWLTVMDFEIGSLCRSG